MSETRKIYGMDDIMPFGKYKGKKIQEVTLNNFTYIKWMIRKDILLFGNDVISLLLDQEESFYDDGYMGTEEDIY